MGATKPYRIARADESENGLDFYLNNLQKYPPLKQDEEIRYAKKKDDGDEFAREELICRNLRFVVHIAKKYQNRGLALDDLINIGNSGLIKAVDRFDYKQGVKLISYAVWWIRQSILHDINEQGGIFPIPQQRAQDLNRLRTLTISIEQELGIPYHDALYRAEMQLKKEIPRISELSAIVLYQKSAPVRFDQPIADSRNATLADIIHRDEPTHADEIAERELRSRLNKLIHHDTPPTKGYHLNAREQKIIDMYFGLGNETERTLEDIGSILGVTRERVRQLKERALRRLLQHPGLKEIAQDYDFNTDRPPNA